MTRSFLIVSVCVFVLITALLSSGFAQNSGETRRFEAQVRPLDAVNLQAGNTVIELWGVRGVESTSALFLLKARSSLDASLNEGNVQCDLKSRSGNIVVAQCFNSSGLDLGLNIVQNGYGTADRRAVFNTAFEGSYVRAEERAREDELGVWSDSFSQPQDRKTGWFILGGVLLVCLTGLFAVLSMIVMRGFNKVTNAQNQSIDIMMRERELKDKERAIFATMLDTEIKANKSKIEAYLAVYDELLKELRNPEKSPKYQKTGDIVQAQPALERSVFDRNTDKLDILGSRLSSEVIHFYARIKSKPDYVNLDVDMPPQQAQKLVEKVYENAQRLNKISDRLIDLFERGGHGISVQDDAL